MTQADNLTTAAAVAAAAATAATASIIERVAKVETLVSERSRVSDQRFDGITAALQRLESKIDNLPNNRSQITHTSVGAGLGGGIVGGLLLIGRILGWW